VINDDLTLYQIIDHELKLWLQFIIFLFPTYDLT
jgi:hypothetical protein